MAIDTILYNKYTIEIYPYTHKFLPLPPSHIPPPQLVFGERSLKCAESMQNLATVLDSLGRSEEAGLLLTKALSIEEEVPVCMCMCMCM